MRKIIYSSLVLLGLILSSCTDGDLEPKLSINKPSTEIKTVGDLKIMLGGAYDIMTTFGYYGRNVMVFGDVRSDNAYANGNSGRFRTSAAMNMTNADSDANDAFLRMYAVIANCNIILDATIVVDPNIVGNEAEINYVKGQALALRALVHYDLVRIYGQQHVAGGDLSSLGVSYVKHFLDSNAMKPKRSTVEEVKSFVYADLDKALSMMDKAYDKGNKKAIRTITIHAIKARVALYFGDWDIAKTASQEVIDNSGARLLTATEYADSFKANLQPNSIFELVFTSDDNLTNNSLFNIYNNTGYGDIVVLEDLKDQFSSSDVRGNMISVQEKFRLRNTGKFIKADVNVVLFRFEEMLLINAESTFRLNEADPLALASLNLLAINRGATPYESISVENILLERRKELCFEGFRFDDIARTKMNMPVVDAVKQTYDDLGLEGITYGSSRYAFPIPLKEMNANPNIVQNMGY
ncbi:RagB/SusD family nutrient uptake outer membrane protein [Flavobacterium branchiarum]|uniref:RagB/SusD family nutrient uptake outer membrane protein n=1 Tax=Flavobacterium branchiarum TaxID=1114870 RepID=A0ABV5FLN8_9FLAO|nr:RagB/SusD family nutrient uptake outer membrane protein [Flavobacterium branchiarum]MDN3674454.1 RagB/SusD family nutrient uptake outer membrane protein [Flavobacterium branchiarum]